MRAETGSGDGVPWKWLVAGAALLALAMAGYFLPVEEWAEAFEQWIRQLGVWGGIVFAAAYVLATVLVMPGWPLSLVAGLAYGVALGFPLVVVSATVGATLAFLISRYLLREQVEKKVRQRDLFRAIDRAISDRGWRVVGLLRLSPIVPFNLQNYLWGVTGIKFRHYVAATFIGMMPGTLMYVYFGAAGKAAVAGGAGERDALAWALFGAGLVATILVAVSVTRRARRELDDLISAEKKASGS